MEVMQRLKAEVVENPKAAMRHLKEDLEDMVEEALLKRRSSGSTHGSTLTTVSSETTSFSSSSSRSGEPVAVDEQVDEKAAAAAGDGYVDEQLEDSSVYLDKDEGTGTGSSQINGEVDGLGTKGDHIQEIMYAVMHGKPVGTSAGPSKKEQDGAVELEENDEEVVELEFETAVQTMHSHDGYGMYCPNCSNQITKVVLRRKIRKRRAAEDDDQRLVGCLSCFSIFVPSGNKLNPFRIFAGPDENTQLQQSTPSGTGCNPLWIFRRGKDADNATEEQRKPREPSPMEESTEKKRDEVIKPGKRYSIWSPFGKGKDQVYDLTSPLLPEGETQSGPTQSAEDVVIDVDKPGDNVPGRDVGTQPPGTGPLPGLTPSSSVATRPPIPPESRSPRSVEIVKSVVYGGLMESMASLSVVSSAAASDSTTLNIVVLGLANLVGGFVVLAHNLKDLRYGESDQTEEEIELRYKKELGKRQHFPLHVFVAVVSYIIFGLLPPAIYGSTFRETNDRDYKMLAVAGASLLSVFMLAIGKAYARGERGFTGYFKTVSYYITSAVMVAGISFAVGELAERFVQQLGWLDPPAPVSGLRY